MYEQIVAILKELKPTKDLTAVTDIIDGGYLDSFELMNLIMILSETFNMEIDFEQITAENFNSIEAMVQMVQSSKKEG